MKIVNQTAEQLTALAKEVNQSNKKWWETPDGQRIERNPHELLMLVISEIAEAMEGERKDLMDDHLPHRKMAEVEMADAAIRILDYIGGFDLSFIEEKLAFFTPDNKVVALFLITESITSCVNLDYHCRPLTAAMQMIINYCKVFGYDLDAAATEKTEYNKTRADHSHEERAKANGKKF